MNKLQVVLCFSTRPFWVSWVSFQFHQLRHGLPLSNQLVSDQLILVWHLKESMFCSSGPRWIWKSSTTGDTTAAPIDCSHRKKKTKDRTYPTTYHIPTHPPTQDQPLNQRTLDVIRSIYDDSVDAGDYVGVFDEDDGDYVTIIILPTIKTSMKGH